MRVLTIGLVPLATGCLAESWIYAPYATETILIEEGVREVSGSAVLRYDPDGMPTDGEVSNALRMAADAERSAWVLSFPGASPQDLIPFTNEAELNLEGVYTWCQAATCEVTVPFRLLRAETESELLEVSGDAILTQETVIRRDDLELDRASLVFTFDGLTAE